MYKLYITPPDYFTLIWIVIHLLLTMLIIYVTCKNTWPIRSYIPLNIVNVANAVWIGVWSIGTNDAIFACSIITLLIPSGLLSLWVSLYDSKANDWPYYVSRNIIAFYLGWMLACSTINFGIVLTYVFGVSQKEFTIIFWALVPILAVGVTIMNSMIQGCNGFKSFMCLWVSALWALSGALISTLDNKQNL
jgi:hypothetical protein